MNDLVRRFIVFLGRLENFRLSEEKRKDIKYGKNEWIYQINWFIRTSSCT